MLQKACKLREAALELWCLPSLRGNLAHDPCSSMAHFRLSTSSIHTSETKHCDGNVHTLPHFPMPQREQNCLNRWGMSVKDKSPESSGDLLPGDHLQIKVTVCFLPVVSICLSFWCGEFIKTQEKGPFSIKVVMQCSFALECLKCFPKEQTFNLSHSSQNRLEF